MVGWVHGGKWEVFGRNCPLGYPQIGLLPWLLWPKNSKPEFRFANFVCGSFITVGSCILTSIIYESHQRTF